VVGVQTLPPQLPVRVRVIGVSSNLQQHLRLLSRICRTKNKKRIRFHGSPVAGDELPTAIGDSPVYLVMRQ